jgi:hypothetical protein
MLHVILNKRAKFSQIVNGNVTWYKQKAMFSQIVYVNILKRRAKVSNSLCECYMIFWRNEPSWLTSSQIVYVNVTHYILKQRAKFSICFIIKRNKPSNTKIVYVNVT